MRTDLTIPSAWRAALGAVQSVVPQAVLAGGALRDRDNGKKVKDLDIFLPVSENTWYDLDTVCRAMTKMDFEATISESKMYPQSDNRIVGVVDVKYVGAPPLQLIVGEWGRSINDLFQLFDFGICQIAFDGRDIHRSKDYAIDLRDKKFRLVTPRTTQSFEQSVERFARLKHEKYQDWKFDLGHWGGLFTGSGGFRFVRDEFVVPVDSPLASQNLHNVASRAAAMKKDSQRG